MAENQDDTTKMTIVLAGKSGAGKSTLMESLLGSGAYTPLCAESVTKYCIRKDVVTNNGVTISIIDTPGLNEKKKQKKMEMKRLAEFTKGEADLLLYCMLVGPGARFDDANPMIMEYLQKAFGKGIWKNCILVFTQSNTALRHISDYHNQPQARSKAYKHHLSHYAEVFEAQLKKLGVKDSVSTALNRDKAATIVGVPAGLKPEDEVLLGVDTPLNWRDFIMQEMVNRGKKPEALLKYRYGPEMLRMGMGAGVGGMAGTVIGLLVGASVGATLGLVGGPPGVAAGAAAGSMVGAMVVGGMAGGAAGLGKMAVNKVRARQGSDPEEQGGCVGAEQDDLDESAEEERVDQGVQERRQNETSSASSRSERSASPVLPPADARQRHGENQQGEPAQDIEEERAEQGSQGGRPASPAAQLVDNRQEEGQQGEDQQDKPVEEERCGQGEQDGRQEGSASVAPQPVDNCQKEAWQEEDQQEIDWTLEQEND